MRACDICEREIIGITCIIFILEQKGIRAIYDRGYNLFVCHECNMCYLAQFFEMSNGEISDWAKWSLNF